MDSELIILYSFSRKYSGRMKTHSPKFFVLNGKPRGVCVDLNGFVNVSCYPPHVVFIYDPRKSYQLLQTLGDGFYGSAPGQFYYPAGMCVDDLNTLMVVDYGNHRVQFFD